MIPELTYFRPEKLEQALQLLNEYKEDARIIAGGTDILPGFRQNASRFSEIKYLVDSGKLKDLKNIQDRGDAVVFGSAVTFSDLVKSPIISGNFPLLTKAAQNVGSVQIRNRATCAGNFINNAPCADSVPPLLVYDARVKIQSLSNQREIQLSELLDRPYRTQLGPDEMVTQIILPKISNDFCGEFYKLGRRRGVAISRITLALLVKTNDSKIEEFRIASGAVTPIGKRFPDIEKFACGKRTSSDLFMELAKMLGQHILDVTGLRWSTEYKIKVVQQMFYQLLEKTLKF